MHDILGIGNAICDIIVQVEDHILEKFNLTKGSMSLFTESKNLEILSYLKDNNYQFKLCSGGSVANTINYLSQYKLNTAFLGNVSSGFYGKRFNQELEDANIKFYNTNTQKSSEPIGSAKCIILVTEDGERTMCTSLGCAADLDLDNIDLNQVSNSKYIYIEGYLWDHAKTIDAIRNVVKKAQTLKSKIVFSLSDSFCVKRHHKSFQEFIYKDVDILFANEAEICALFELNELDNMNTLLIQKKMLDMNPSHLVITKHDKGCIVITDELILPVSTVEKEALDTTGAGDAFAAGFLYGLSCELDLSESAHIANYVAGQVVSHLGARPEIILPKTMQELTKKVV